METLKNSRRVKRRDTVVQTLSEFDQLPSSAHVRVGVVAALFGCSPATVWRRSQSGVLRPKKIGGTTVWNVGELRAALSSQLQGDAA